ncbi:MAG: hypothetical protein IJY61_00935 [Candidatus Gastranaerophilales bacterium]|nr:hypothetical protein [Candidatus Gastranaerophilales bacterium]
MGHDFFNSFSIGRGGFGKGFGKDIEEMFKQEGKTDASSHLISEAMSLGISVNTYCKTDEEGNVEVSDRIGLQEAIKEAKNKKEGKNETKTDAFVSTTKKEDNQLSDDDKIKAANLQKDIEEKIAKTQAEYDELVNSKADSNTDEGRLSNSWAEAEEQSLKFIGVTASNTTVLEGAKEFINRITGIVNDAESTKVEKDKNEETGLYSDSNKNIEDTNNRINVFSLYGEDSTNKYMTSAINTFDVEANEKKGRREFVA